LLKSEQEDADGTQVGNNMNARERIDEVAIDVAALDGNGDKDRGYTLIEMLISILLMSTVVLSIMGGMWAVVRASSQNDSRAKVQAILGSAGDAVVNYKHWNCPEINNAYLEYAQKGAKSVGWPASTVQITRYQYWDPRDALWKDTNTVTGSGCDEKAGLTPNKTMQKLTITATSPNGQYVSSIEVVKADIRPEEIRDVTTP